jgi:hypothetical protein
MTSISVITSKLRLGYALVRSKLGLRRKHGIDMSEVREAGAIMPPETRTRSSPC